MKNDYITVVCLLIVAVECMEAGNIGFFDSNFDNLKVNLKKIQKKQPDNQEAPKEPPKQVQTGKSQKELLEEQLQQIQKYTPSNVTIEGGRVFTQNQPNDDENFYEEEELNDEDEVLLAIKQIDPDAQFDGIEFIFKKRQLDEKRMIALLTMIDNGEIEISFKQIKQLIKKYQFESVFQKAIQSLNIEPEEEYEEFITDEGDYIAQQTNDENLSFDDLIDFDNDELQAQYEETIPNEDFIFDEPDLEIDSIEDIYQEEMIHQHYEEQYEKIDDQGGLEESEEEWDYFEELRELNYTEETEEEQMQNNSQYEEQFEEIAVIVQSISSPSDNILSKEEQNSTYLGDDSLSEMDFTFKDNPDQVKFQKEFDLVPKVSEGNLTALKAQFNLSEESLASINSKYEQMDSQFNPIPETSPNPEFIQPQFIQLSQVEEKPKFLQDYNSTQVLDANYFATELTQTSIEEPNLLQTQQVQESDDNSLDEFKKSFDQLDSINETQMKQETQLNQDISNQTSEQEIQQLDNEDQNQLEKEEEEQQQKPIENSEKQSSKSNIKQTTSKPAQPHELIMSNPTSEITEKSEEEIAKEKELKAKARYAKRYQALEIENENNKKKEEEETNYVKVEQNIDDIFIIQSLASTKKNNVVEMKDLKEETLISKEDKSNTNIEIYNSNSEDHPQKNTNHKTQHFVEAFVQDMSLKSFTCDPKYFGPNKEARSFACECSDKIFLLDEESWYLAGSIQYYKQFEKIFEQIKKSIPQVYVGTSKERVCFSSQSHQPIILNDFLKEMFLKTKIQNNFITIPNVLSLSYVQMEFSENKVNNFIMEVESNDEIKLNYGFNIKRIDMRLAQEDLHIQYIGSFLTHQQQIPFRLTNEYGKLKIDTMEVTVQLPQDEQICLQICSQILSGDVAKQLQAFLNFKKGQYYITVKVLSSNESFEIFYSIRS